MACVENLAGKVGHVNYATVPGIVYTHPEVASVGLTEEQAKEQKLNFKVRTLFAWPRDLHVVASGLQACNCLRDSKTLLQILREFKEDLLRCADRQVSIRR